MQTIENILSAYNLSKYDIQQISEETKQTAIGCGTRGVYKSLSSKTWTLLDEISDEVWYSEIEINSKISLGFQLYELFPSYYHFLLPFYRGIRNEEITLIENKKIIWGKFTSYLSSEAYYADPVSYILWVEFFEDITTVRDAWQGLINSCPNKKALLVMLEVAGPVPFDLKEKYYELLLPDNDNHAAIFNSLLHSAFDVYGEIDKRKASAILNKLSVDVSDCNYNILKEKLR
jgi:hypothetical protein